MAWVEVPSGARVAKKQRVSQELHNKISTLVSITDDIKELMSQINFVMEGTEGGAAEGWLRCCEQAKDLNILGGGRAKEALTYARDIVSLLSDCEWEWVSDDD
ncbi:MAG: hypothetical protein LBQ80_04575 [Clostridium sp.]|jgi:hypothetical protein|nr:hypothetical protein [Clostridium sp.]